MPDYKKQGNKKPFDGKRELTMHPATCAECKKNCQVPFKPTGEKPVLCSDCHNAAKPGNHKSSFKKPTDERILDSREERQLKKLIAEVESLHLKIDSLTRSMKTIVDFVNSNTESKSLGDVMSEAGLKTKDED